jgi:hypothetical protein
MESTVAVCELGPPPQGQLFQEVPTAKDKGILYFHITQLPFRVQMQSIPFFPSLSGKHGSKNLQSFFTWIRRWSFFFL